MATETTSITSIICNDPWFSLLESGEKPVEGRKGTPIYRNLKAGDPLCFRCPGTDRKFLATVVKVDSFKTLIEYLQGVTLEKALPGVASLEEGVQIYSQWSTPEQIKDFGFVGIWIKLDRKP